MGGEEVETDCIDTSSEKFCCQGKEGSETVTTEKKTGSRESFRKDPVE